MDPAPSSGLASCRLEVQVEGESTWTELSQDCTGADYVYDQVEPRTDYTFRLTAIDNADNDAWTEETASVRIVTKYYYFGGKRVAMRGPDEAVVWLHGDHLGSTSLATSAGPNPEVISRQLYYPFGETRWTSEEAMPTDFGFTGQRNQSTIGLYDYHARFYDPQIGRFVSADSIIPNVANPQEWNRYSYTLNNPANLIDPSGYQQKPPEYDPFAIQSSGTTGPYVLSADTTVQYTVEIPSFTPQPGPRRVWSRSEEIQKAQAAAAEKAQRDAEKAQREYATWSAIMWGYEAVGAFGGAYVGAQGAGQQGNSRSWMTEGQAALLAGPDGTGTPQFERYRNLPQPPLSSWHRNWVPYQTYVTRKTYEEEWILSDGETTVCIDGLNADYVVEAKYVDSFTEWGSVYHPRNRYYDEPYLINQAWRQVRLAQELGLKGVRWVMNDGDAAGHFRLIFDRHPETQHAYRTGFLHVYVVPKPEGE